MSRVLALLLVVTAVAGCGGGTDAYASLTTSAWVLDRLVGADGSVQRGDGARLTFGAEGTLSLASCNLCTARYRLSNDVLTVAPAQACTQRACAPGGIELERYVAEPMTVERDGIYLVLDPVDPASTVPQLVFVPEAPAVGGAPATPDAR